jgi:hypothetical protein
MASITLSARPPVSFPAIKKKSRNGQLQYRRIHAYRSFPFAKNPGLRILACGRPRRLKAGGPPGLIGRSVGPLPLGPCP